MSFFKVPRIKNKKLMNSYHSTEECVICGLSATPAHIKGVGAGGDDVKQNMAPLCGKHHTEQGSTGMKSFANKYKSFKEWLLNNGWQFDEFIQKWRLYRGADGN